MAPDQHVMVHRDRYRSVLRPEEVYDEDNVYRHDTQFDPFGSQVPAGVSEYVADAMQIEDCSRNHIPIVIAKLNAAKRGCLLLGKPQAISTRGGRWRQGRHSTHMVTTRGNSKLMADIVSHGIVSAQCVSAHQRLDERGYLEVPHQDLCKYTVSARSVIL